MSRHKSTKSESPVAISADLVLRGPLSEPHNQAFLLQLRAMPEFAQTFQFVHLFKRGLQVAEPVDIEVLEEELVSFSGDMGRLTRQITWALVRAYMRTKKKNVDDLDLWSYCSRIWENHRDEWDSACQQIEARKDETENDEVEEGTLKRESESPPPESPPPVKRARSTRSRTRSAMKESLAEEVETNTKSTRSRKKGVKAKAEEVKLEESRDEAAPKLTPKEAHELELRNHNRKLIIADLDFNPFVDSPTLVSTFARFDAFQLVKIWFWLIQWIFDHEGKCRDIVETTLQLTDLKPEELRSEPIGWDADNLVYYLFGDSRLYKRAERVNSSGFDMLDLDVDSWRCVCATWQDWEAFLGSLESRGNEYKDYKRQASKSRRRKSSAATMPDAEIEALKYDSELYEFFTAEIMPVVKEVFVEKARASVSREKERQLEVAMATRKTSSRIQALQAKREEQERLDRKMAESREAARLESKRLQRIELQRKQMEERHLARERRFERRNNTSSAEPETFERRRAPRRAAAAAATSWTFDCVCGIHGQNYEDDKAMIECETCKTWMHIECLKDRRNVNEESFECDVCGTREDREAQAREEKLLEEEKLEKKRKAEEERLQAEEEKAKLKKLKNAQRWQERKKRMKEKKEAERLEAERMEAERLKAQYGDDYLSRSGTFQPAFLSPNQSPHQSFHDPSLLPNFYSHPPPDPTSPPSGGQFMGQSPVYHGQFYSPSQFTGPLQMQFNGLPLGQSGPGQFHGKATQAQATSPVQAGTSLPAPHFGQENILPMVPVSTGGLGQVQTQRPQHATHLEPTLDHSSKPTETLPLAPPSGSGKPQLEPKGQPAHTNRGQQAKTELPDSGQSVVVSSSVGDYPNGHSLSS